MNFTELLSKMQELDRPVTEPTMADQPVEDCGMPGPMSSPMSKPDTPPPSMSINLNAQGLDNIEELMKLIKAVNPDAAEKPMGNIPPSISIEPMDSPMDKPMGMPPLKLGNLDSGPLKMLPDMDAGNDDMPGGEKDKGKQPGGLGASLDRDNDGDHDMKDHDLEKKDKDEAFSNSLGDSEPNTMDVDAAIPDGNDLHKAKKSYSDKPYRGDNPMAVEGNDLRSQIRSELLRRLEEAKAK
jgi:hypothetical protein